MEVLLLGTGAADGWPSPFCECVSCTDARAACHVRRPTAALLDGVILVDAGPAVPTAVAEAGRSLRAVHHILVTHAHTDHLDPALLLWLSWNPTAHTVHVWGPRGVIDACAQWIGPSTPVMLHALEAGDSAELLTPAGTWRMRSLSASHDPADFGGSHDPLAAEALLFDITSPDESRLLYATDTGPLPDSTISAMSKAAYDVVLIEETFGDRSGHRTGHLDLSTLPKEVLRLHSIGAITDTTDIVAVHLGHHNPPREELRQRLAAHGVRLVDDGTILGQARRSLILGGSRSGKSREAERRARAFTDVTYVATADPRPDDPEWRARVEEHQRRRPCTWRTLEGHRAAVSALRESRPGQAIIIDCLTLWLTGILDEAANRGDWAAVNPDVLREAAEQAARDLVAALRAAHGTILLVSNEVGWGVIPATAAGRLFADLLGRLHQDVAAVCDETVLMVAGRSLDLGGAR